MKDFGFIVGGQLCVSVDISNYVKIEGTTASIELPTEAELAPVSTDRLKILYVEFDPKLVYQGDVKRTISGWRYLIKENVPLNRASTMLAVYELNMMLLSGYFSLVPLLVSLPEMAFLVHRLQEEGIAGITQKLISIRRRLKGDIRHADKELKKGMPPFVAIQPLVETVLGTMSELQICGELIEAGFNVKINPSAKGPDLFVNGRNIKVEIAKKFERFNFEEYKTWIKIAEQAPDDAFIPFHPRALLATLSLAIADRIEEELSQGDVVLIDVSNLLEGAIMIGFKTTYENKQEFSLGTVMNKALELAGNGHKSVIFYARARSVTGTISVAFGVEADIILNFVSAIKRCARLVISFRKKYPYTTVKLFSDLFSILKSAEPK